MYKKITIKKILLVILTTILMVLMGPRVNAETAQISVKAILPDNQYNPDVSYYHLEMKAGQKQEIELQLFNSSKKEATALITLAAATTNDNGSIDYSLPEKEVDDSLLYPFTEIASTPKEVKIPAESDVTTKISIKMPAEEYEGMILGGVNITAKEEAEPEKEKSGGGMKINNKLKYAIAVALIENEVPVKTDMELERVFAGQRTGRNVTQAVLKNPTAAVIENLAIEAKIYAKGKDEILYQTKVENYRMAPNSSFNFGIPLGDQSYKAGEYVIKLVAVSDPKNPKDGEKQTWEFDSEFKISRQVAKKLNEESIDFEPVDYTMYYIIGAVILLILVILGGVIYSRNKKAKALTAELETSRRRKKSKN